MYMHICMQVDMWIGMDMIVYKYMYRYNICTSTRIIKLMDVLIVYLICTFVQCFVFTTYTPLSMF